MIMLALLLLCVLFFSSPGYAQSACGEAPIVADEHDRLQLENSASEASKNIGSDKFVQTLQSDRTDIFASYQKGERAIAYYQYIVCQIIDKDKNMTAPAKIQELNKAFSALFVDARNEYSAYSFLVLNRYGALEKVVRSTLKRDGSTWLEIQLNRVVFSFDELGRSDNYIHLKDASRSLELKLPIRGGPSLMRYTGEQWQVWNEMHPVMNEDGN